MSEDWGPWVEHDGTGVPPDVVGRTVLAQWESFLGSVVEEVGFVGTGYSESPSSLAWDWAQFGRIAGGMRIARVIRYRVRRPRELLKLIEMVETLPSPHPVEVEA